MHTLVCVYNHTEIIYLQLTLPAAHAHAGVYITRVFLSFIWTIVSPSINPIAYILLLLQNNEESGEWFLILHNCPLYWSFITPLGRFQADRLPHTFTWPSAWGPMPTESVTQDHSYSALTHKPTQIHSLALSCMKRILM